MAKQFSSHKLSINKVHNPNCCVASDEDDEMHSTTKKGKKTAQAFYLFTEQGQESDPEHSCRIHN